MLPPVYLLMMVGEIIHFPPHETGFLIDESGNFISDETNTPILYSE